MKLRYAVLCLLLLIACSNRNTPQAVTEDFIYNYYKLANQEAALLLSSGLATEKLEAEIGRLQEVRVPGDPAPEMPKIEYKQLGKETANEVENVTHVLFNYQLIIKNRGGTTTHTRNVVITTEDIDGQWKVVNFDEY
ncbi:MAG: hypothetical protein OXI67_06965 [Candidatus Poribacteria bacterium]|nr:hypothetical protein [Candidatus Poribacteria bacterium]